MTRFDYSNDIIGQDKSAMRKVMQLIGIEFNGVMCSATPDDQNRLATLLLRHTIAKLTGGKLPDINFRFENGNVLVINSDNIEALDQALLPFI